METVAAVVLPIVAVLLIFGIMRAVALNARVSRDEPQAQRTTPASPAPRSATAGAPGPTDRAAAAPSDRGNVRDRR